MEARVGCDELEEVVVLTLFLDGLTRLHAELTDLLMQLLTITTGLDGIHHDVLGRHERKLRHEVLADHLRVHHETVNDVQVEIEDTIDREEALRYGQTLVCGVVQGTLEPLRGGYQHWIHEIGDHVVCQGGDTLGTHRVPLIRHRAGTDLVLLERLLDLLHVLEHTDVVRELMCGLGDAGEHAEHTEIDLTAVGLAGYRIAGREAHLLCDHLIELAALRMITVEELEEGRLGAGGTLRSEKLQGAEYILEILEVEHELVQPQGRTLADGCRLCRLEVGIRKCRHILILHRELAELVDDIDELLMHELEALPHDDDIRVVADIAGGRTEVDDALRIRALYAVCVHMAHNIVTHFLLTCLCHLIIDLILMCLQLIDLLLCDVETQLMLRLCQCDPELSPGTELVVL